ncbi:MAG: DUF721 domain-containing protein [Nitrospinae bacterium]|nr:DUF721 domain-containing protein [Nitrospinota bacterium]
MAPLGSILGRALSAVSHGSLYDLAMIEERWGEIVGEGLRAVSLPAELERKKLVIWVKEPVWADSMGYLKDEITGKINNALEKKVVDGIKVVYRRDFDRTRPSPPAAQEEPDTRLVSPETLLKIEEEAAKVEDSELREAIKRVMLKSVIANIDKKH